MSRSLKKGPFVDARLAEKVIKARQTNSRVTIKTWRRASTITPEMVGMTFGVHNGKNFINVFVEENMVGHKLGEFSPTRKFVVHGGKMAKDQAAAAAATAAAPVATPAGAKPAAAKPAAKK